MIEQRNMRSSLRKPDDLIILANECEEFVYFYDVFASFWIYFHR